MGNRNSSNSKVHHGQATRVASTDSDYDPGMGRSVGKFRNGYIGKPKEEIRGTLKGSGVYSDNTPLYNDDTFTTFIRQAKYKIRTVSHIAREQSYVAPSPPSDDDNQNDQFSNFIQNAKKLRSTSSMRKNGSFGSG
ncbi:hypothetical protein CR513_33237, partial [Mucuna pruriens]